MRAWPWVLGTIVQLALVVATAFPPFAQTGSTAMLGYPTWHHNVALLAVAVWVAVQWRRFTTDRRFLGLGVLVTTFLALASAFLLLYLKQQLKATYLKDWAKFWHVAWSWAALAFFLGHTWVNRHGLVRSLGKLTSTRTRAAWFWGPLGVITFAIPLTWSPLGADVFTDPIYIPLTLYTWLAFLLPAYGTWLVATLSLRRAPTARLTWWTRPGRQAFTDGWLLPMTVLANVSGFPILYFGTKDTALKYVAKYWHTWPSIAMAILVFAHTVMFWAGVRAYSRKAAASATVADAA